MSKYWKFSQVLIDIVSQMAQGNAVTLNPVHAELTTQEVANYIFISIFYRDNPQWMND